jgi:uncharacterized protein (TIGR00251 family)
VIEAPDAPTFVIRGNLKIMELGRRSRNSRVLTMEPAKMKQPNPSGSQEPNNKTGRSFFWWEGDTLVVNILGKPSATCDVIGKVKGTQLKVSVTAAPRAGRATDHMVRFLAGEFGVPSSAIEVVFGRMNINKQLRIKAPQKLPVMFQQSSLSNDLGR